jgi:hypothetical protein
MTADARTPGQSASGGDRPPLQARNIPFLNGRLLWNPVSNQSS